MGLRFRFRWIPFIAALCMAAIGVALGQWQTGRALEKEAIAARLAQRGTEPPLTLTSGHRDPDAVEYRRTVISGEFMPDWNVYLDNRPHNGVAGFHLVTPFRISGTDDWVLVARGWLPRHPADRTRLPRIDTPAGRVQLEGVIRRHAGRVMELGTSVAAAPGAIVQNVSVEQMALATGKSFLPFIVEQTGAGEQGLVRDWPQPSAGADKHRGYAFQWYALAAMALAFFVVTGFRRGTSQAKT